MKRKYDFITGLFICLSFFAGLQGFALEKTKEYHESWPAGSVQTLEINNKFGEVKVTDKGGGSVTIDVVVTVEAASEKFAGELLDQITVTTGKTGNTVAAETNISRDFKANKRFSIDYEVNIPPDRNLQITNKYGNTFVNILNANGMFDIQHGNFTAIALNTPAGGSMDVTLAYGKADIESAKELNTTVQYSTINLGKAGKLILNSKYNVVHIEEAGSIEAESIYDTFNFGVAGSVSVHAKYTRIQTEEVLKILDMEAGYGGIKVDRVDSGFESISVTSSYGQVSLGLGDASYSLDAICDYCEISYPESSFSGDRIRENQSHQVKGKVGSATGGTVFVKSRYGQVKLD